MKNLLHCFDCIRVLKLLYLLKRKKHLNSDVVIPDQYVFNKFNGKTIYVTFHNRENVYDCNEFNKSVIHLHLQINKSECQHKCI